MFDCSLFLFCFVLRTLQSGLHSSYNISHSHQWCTRIPAFPCLQHLKKIVVIVSGCEVEGIGGVCIYIHTYIMHTCKSYEKNTFM